MPIHDRYVSVHDGHRGLLFRDGQYIAALDPGRHSLAQPGFFAQLIFGQRPAVYELVAVDIRDRDLTIKGQEILTADKVAIRVSILVQFRVSDAVAAVQKVANYEDRLYSDVQLAARRSLAGMTLEEILTERNRLSEDILREVKDPAARYGVEINRADVKDLAFPGNLQEIMNRVLAAERQAQVQLIDARTKAEISKIEAISQSEAQLLNAERQAAARRATATAEADVMRIKTEAELEALAHRREAAMAYADHPALLRLVELETLRDMAAKSNEARLYVDFAAATTPRTGPSAAANELGKATKAD